MQLSTFRMRLGHYCRWRSILHVDSCMLHKKKSSDTGGFRAAYVAKQLLSSHELKNKFNSATAQGVQLSVQLEVRWAVLVDQTHKLISRLDRLHQKRFISAMSRYGCGHQSFVFFQSFPGGKYTKIQKWRDLRKLPLFFVSEGFSRTFPEVFQRYSTGKLVSITDGQWQPKCLRVALLSDLTFLQHNLWVKHVWNSSIPLLGLDRLLTEADACRSSQAPICVEGNIWLPEV